MTVRERFLKGQYLEIARAFDQGRLSLTPSSRNWIAASLALTGRVDDAVALAQKDDTLAQFYIAVAMTRASRFPEARLRLVENAIATPRDQRFFSYQGFGFYAFFEGRFKKALFWADKAWLIALQTRSLHERVLSADLRGHALLQMGETTKGLESLETAFDIAGRINNKAHLTALRASIAIANSSTTQDSEATVLANLLEESSQQDSYTGANILIELARQHNLRGRYREALKVIGNTRTLIRTVRHRRQEASLAVREAYSLFRLGESDRAISIIERAERKLTSQDRAVLVELKGLHLQILRAQGRAPRLQRELEKLVRRLAHEVDSARCRHYLARLDRAAKKRIEPISTNPIERLLLGEGDLRSRTEVFRRSHLQLFEELIDSHAEHAIIIGLSPQSILLRFQRELYRADAPLPPLLQRGLLLLAKNRLSKAELVELLWGYRYDSLRHDTLIYSFIRRLRLALGPIAALLRHRESTDSYGFDETVKVTVIENAYENDGSITDPSLRVESPVRSQSNATLNFRQIETLSFLHGPTTQGTPISERSVAPQDLILRYKVSRITATRDLTDLTKKGLLTRWGAGRGTRYVLKSTKLS